MYRNQDSDHGQTPTRAVPVPEAQPINQTEFTELQRGPRRKYPPRPSRPPRPAILPPPLQTR